MVFSQGEVSVFQACQKPAPISKNWSVVSETQKNHSRSCITDFLRLRDISVAHFGYSSFIGVRSLHCWCGRILLLYADLSTLRQTFEFLTHGRFYEKRIVFRASLSLGCPSVVVWLTIFIDSDARKTNILVSLCCLFAVDTLILVNYLLTIHLEGGLCSLLAISCWLFKTIFSCFLVNTHIFICSLLPLLLEGSLWHLYAGLFGCWLFAWKKSLFCLLVSVGTSTFWKKTTTFACPLKQTPAHINHRTQK